jgi:single-strand DNA-binding protein
MASVNKAIIVGNLGKSPKVGEVGGDKVATFSVATNMRYKDKEGNNQEKTEWHNVVCWGRLAEICEEYLKTGSPVYVEGRLQTREWEGKDGTTKQRTEIVCQVMQMLGKKDGGKDTEADSDDDGMPW